MAGKKHIYFFGSGKAEGNAGMKEILGGKGANLAEMTNLAIPVPPGFTVSTEVCAYYDKNNGSYPEGLEKAVRENILKIENIMGKRFGDMEAPLLVSVRSGARVSMPGMMDTVLNLGLNDDTVKGVVKQSQNERFAYDNYRRFLQMYGNVVMGLKPENQGEEDPFELIIDSKKKKKGVKHDTDLDADDLKELVCEFKTLIKERLGKSFPEDPWEQLWGAIGAVFASWENQRAVTYRRLHNIPDHWGTAINIQAMVFGNMGDDSATGVAFTRDPSTGENKFYGEFLVNAQGEDVVAGIRTPQPINKDHNTDTNLPSLEEVMPETYRELVELYTRLEKHYRDMQDIEFTIERGRLWLLQTRNGKRTSRASIKIAVDMVEEGLIDEKTAILRVDANQLDQLLHPNIDPTAKKNVIAKGLPASPGAAVGEVVFTADEAESLAADGKKIILVRIETSPEDIHGMHASQGILTARGGMTSHAAVVGRGMGKCCVVGCGDIKIDYTNGLFKAGDITVRKGDTITLDGGTGEVILGEVRTINPELSRDFEKIMAWVDKYKKLKVRANADTPKDARVARSFGAEGIGLCRTEHMFFEEDRIRAVREMILATDEEGRKRALEKILPMQKEDFKEIFKAMDGFPVTIRLLDPPLHEFLPQKDSEIEELASEMSKPFKIIKEKVESLKEFNPMLGHRGCRLGITYPEIYEMQVRAIMEAACEITKEGYLVIPEIMVPLVGMVSELKLLKEHICKVCSEVQERCKVSLEYTIGTMIELPRAAITADEIAAEAEFFSFGTNDLTQTGYGLSRDDSGSFLPYYIEKKLIEKDPFVVLDRKGIGELIRIGVQKGREVRPEIKLGICGEHGGEPSSVEFCHNLGLHYVSCSPYRVPIARLAAAQAALNEKKLD
jgi:pyruvate,orthophosphate dikinase